MRYKLNVTLPLYSNELRTIRDSLRSNGRASRINGETQCFANVGLRSALLILGCRDSANIHAVITDARNDVYQLSTRAGVIKGWFTRSALRETNANEVGAVGTDRTLGLREAFREQSPFGGQGMKQCACRVG